MLPHRATLAAIVPHHRPAHLPLPDVFRRHGEDAPITLFFPELPQRDLVPRITG
jgi:hypothetical protein